MNRLTQGNALLCSTILSIGVLLWSMSVLRAADGSAHCQLARSHDHGASVSAIVSSGGRIFYVVDEGPIAPTGWSGGFRFRDCLDRFPPQSIRKHTHARSLERSRT
jgi:hypothetical protein